MGLFQFTDSSISLDIPKEIFRAYDIRGIVGRTLTPEGVYNIGRALGTIVIKNNQDNKLKKLNVNPGVNSIVIGRDGRLSGPSLIAALAEGIVSTGCHVIDIGMVPTPLLYFATHHLNIPSGVIITGSHNPPDYNGLKIMINGQAIYGDGIQALYQTILLGEFCKGKGSLVRQDVVDAYIQTVKENVCLKRPLKVIVDCGNGVAGAIAPKLYQALGCEVIPLYCEVDGRFPNHHPDPGQPENLTDLIKAIKMHKADIGLAFDGDADRLGVVDNRGDIIWPDRLLILFAKEILSRCPNADIIFDVKCTRHVMDAIAKLGGKPLMWKTGHSLIKAKMQETGALLAGEMSGHLFFKDRWFGFDDGLYAGARLLEILDLENQQYHQRLKTLPDKAQIQTQAKTASEIFAMLPNSLNTPELMLGIDEQTKFQTVQKLIEFARFQDAEISIIDGLRVDFQDGFGLVRPSNTGPNLIMRFEGDTSVALERIKNQFRELLLSINPKWALPF